ncbi:MAG: hypothetical protein ABI925_01135 [Verrucomicrobiota bacterium]
MFISTSKNSSVLKIAIAATSVAALTISPWAVAEEHHHDKDGAASKEVTGEVVDMMCYVDHNAMGEKHGQSCGVTCIKSGGPVGIVQDGKAYLVVGEHKPMNEELAQYCGKTITLKGKMAERGGVAMIENAEIVKK